MRATILIIFIGLFLSACSHSTYYVDHEHGKATNDAFDRQIVYQDYAHAGKTTEGMAGIHAEPIMETYQNSFQDSFSKESIDIYQVGSDSGGGSGM